MKLIAPDPDMRMAMPYEYTAKPLLTATEARFHECLVQITQERCRIQIKPRLADVFAHEKTNGAFQMISQKHIDFLICRNDDWMPMLGIELDDSSHERAEAKKRDMFVNMLFASTGVPLLRLPVQWKRRARSGPHSPSAGFGSLGTLDAALGECGPLHGVALGTYTGEGPYRSECCMTDAEAVAR